MNDVLAEHEDEHCAYDVWARECAVAALAGQRICPRYQMPCWACLVLHFLTRTLCSINEGPFIKGKPIVWDTCLVRKWAESAPGLVCPHHDDAKIPANHRQRGVSVYSLVLVLG